MNFTTKEPTETCKNCGSTDIMVDEFGDIFGDYIDTCGECLTDHIR